METSNCNQAYNPTTNQPHTSPPDSSGATHVEKNTALRNHAIFCKTELCIVMEMAMQRHGQ